MAKNLISIYNLNLKDIKSILKLAVQYKKADKPVLKGKTLGLIFEKPSTRTTVSFAVAMYKLGGFPLVLNPRNLQRKRGESIQDTAKTLSRYLDAVVIRAFKHKDVEDFGISASIPVINGLTETEHPCQILGDILTIMEKKKLKEVKDLRKIKVVFMGDGNNVSNSWIALSAILGINFVLACPKGYGPDADILKKAHDISKTTGAVISITSDAKKAVNNADVIYTDVWTSMGEESEKEKRKKVFKPFQVNASLVSAAKSNCLVMHCLPAYRGEEITTEVIDGTRSVVFDQAENRLHIQKAILSYLLR